jgi:hypothetical protein
MYVPVHCIHMSLHIAYVCPYILHMYVLIHCICMSLNNAYVFPYILHIYVPIHCIRMSLYSAYVCPYTLHTYVLIYCNTYVLIYCICVSLHIAYIWPHTYSTHMPLYINCSILVSPFWFFISINWSSKIWNSIWVLKIFLQWTIMCCDLMSSEYCVVIKWGDRRQCTCRNSMWLWTWISYMVHCNWCSPISKHSVTLLSNTAMYITLHYVCVRCYVNWLLEAQWITAIKLCFMNFSLALQ